VIVRLGIMTFVKCQVVALDGSRFNPSTRMLIAVKLVDVMVIPLAQSTRDTAFPLKEDPATVVNKVPIFSLISDRCDIFVAYPVTVMSIASVSVRGWKTWEGSPIPVG
jgi:hypothetical protein